MKLLANIMTAFIALCHFGFLVLEMFLWTKPAGLKMFNMTPEMAENTAVLAANQGLYNGFLAAGLVWGLLSKRTDVKVFFLVCIVIAGVYGSQSATQIILFIQALPACIALILIWLSQRKQNSA